jgi:hypothetical protein
MQLPGIHEQRKKAEIRVESELAVLLAPAEFVIGV